MKYMVPCVLLVWNQLKKSLTKLQLILNPLFDELSAVSVIPGDASE